MPNRNIIVMGTSAGGLSAFNRIIKQLPEHLNAAGLQMALDLLAEEKSESEERQARRFCRCALHQRT